MSKTASVYRFIYPSKTIVVVNLHEGLIAFTKGEDRFPGEWKFYAHDALTELLEYLVSEYSREIS